MQSLAFLALLEALLLWELPGSLLFIHQSTAGSADDLLRFFLQHCYLATCGYPQAAVIMSILHCPWVAAVSYQQVLNRRFACAPTIGARKMGFVRLKP